MEGHNSIIFQKAEYQTPVGSSESCSWQWQGRADWENGFRPGNRTEVTPKLTQGTHDAYLLAVHWNSPPPVAPRRTEMVLPQPPEFLLTIHRSRPTYKPNCSSLSSEKSEFMHIQSNHEFLQYEISLN